MIGNHLTRLISNTNKLLEVMDMFDVTFSTNGSFHNDKLFQNEVIGTEIYETFVNDRFHGDISVWALFRKRHLKIFKAELNKTIKSMVQRKVVQLREEKSFFSRSLITSRKPPEIDLEFCLGNYEFSVVPMALLMSDGELLPCTDKARVLHQIEAAAMTNDETLVSDDIQLHQQCTVLIVDGMAVVNQLNRNMKVKTCKVIIVIYHVNSSLNMELSLTT